jgi:amino acid transporter
MYRQSPSPNLPWFWIPARVLLMSLLLALLSFAVCLLLGILGVTMIAWLRGVHPDLTRAYRDIALPAAAIVGLIALVAAIAMEFRNNLGADVPPVLDEGGPDLPFQTESCEMRSAGRRGRLSPRRRWKHPTRWC